jgi:AcrR family transcriptional regulator
MTLESYLERIVLPKETFYNLPDDKRKTIEKTAIKEFAKYGYDKASITRIVENCSIAKGSFYQYFDDRKDLYFYLVTRVAEKKAEVLAPVMERSSEYDFFELIRELFLEGLRFAANNPEINMMGDWLFKNREHPIYKEMVGVGQENARNVYSGLLKTAMVKGEIRDDIDIDFISHTISTLSVSSIEYYFQTKEGKKARVRKFDRKMIDAIDLLIDFLKHGIGTRERKVAGYDKS